MGMEPNQSMRRINDLQNRECSVTEVMTPLEILFRHRIWDLMHYLITDQIFIHPKNFVTNGVFRVSTFSYA